jgi:hypothetical protein
MCSLRYIRAENLLVNTWAPLWSGIVDSSLWDEPDHVCKVFLTMMAVKDADHIVRFSAYQIAKKSRKTEAEVLDALRILSSPDTKRLEPQEFEGRRIKSVEEGWLILNGEKYRSKISLEMKRARNRRAQAVFRERKKKARGPMAGETAYVKVFENEGPEAADRMLRETSPPYITNGSM